MTVHVYILKFFTCHVFAKHDRYSAEKKTNQDCVPIAMSKILFFSYKVGSSYVNYSNSSTVTNITVFCKTGSTLVAI